MLQWRQKNGLLHNVKYLSAGAIMIYDFSSTGHRFAPTITRAPVFVKNPLVALTFLQISDLTKTDRVSSTVTLALGKVCFDLKRPSGVRADQIV